MTAVIEKVRKHERLMQSEAEAAYQRLLVDSWNGVDIDPAEALEILAAAGRDSADLEEACKALDERAAAKKLAGEIPALQAKMDANRATLQAARESLTAAEREFAELAKGIERDNDRIIARLNECDRAAQRLRTESGLRDEDLHHDRQRLTAEQSALSAALAEAESLARPEQIAADRGREENQLEAELRYALRQPQQAGRSADTVRKDLAALEGKYADRITRRDQLRARMDELLATTAELDARAIA